ncbi:MAG: hypothetical protein WD533_00245 [Dehalococcoidia bacterium]
MPRIEGIPEEKATDDVLAIMARQKATRGAVSNTAPIYALRPTIMQGHQALAEGIEQSGLLEPGLRNLAALRAANINGCPF